MDSGSSSNISAGSLVVKDESTSDNRISLPEPKTPAEFALHILRRQFYKIADRKLSSIMSYNLEHEPDFVLNIGPNVDQVFDKILNSLGYIARHKPKPVIDLVLIWRKEKLELKQDGPEPSHKRHLSDTVLPIRGREVDDILKERRKQATLFIVCRTLIEVVKQVRPETLRDDVGKQMEELAFKHILDLRPEEMQRSRHALAVYDLFAELIGELSRIRFMSVSDRFISQLERFTPNMLKEQESKIELLIRGMHFLHLKIYPLEALEETADFLQSLANFLRHAHGVRIKHAYSRLFVRLFMPIAGVAVAEVNFPAWVKAVEILFPKAWQMTLKQRHWSVAYPLATALLCVSQREYFLSHWNSCLYACIKLKDKVQRQMAMGCIVRLLWTFLYRCSEGTNTTYNKLSEIIRHLFPANRRSCYVNLDLFVQFIHFVGIRHHDYCMKNLIFMLMNSENIANSNSYALELIAPERMRIGIRSFMTILYSMQTSELRPPFPSNPDLLDQRQGLGIKISSDVLSDDIFNQAGLKENVDRFCDISYKVALILDQHFGNLTVLDEKNLAKAIIDSNMITYTYGSMTIAYPKDRQPYFNLMREYVDSLPRLLNKNIRSKVVEMLCRYTVHVDPNLARSASVALMRIADQCGAETVITGFSRFVHKIEDKFYEILIGVAPSTTGGAQVGFFGILRLYYDLLKRWLYQLQNKKPNEIVGNSNDIEDPSIWTVIEETEANGLLFLCSRSCMIRKYAISILNLAAELDLQFHERKEKNHSRRSRAISIESRRSGTADDNTSNNINHDETLLNNHSGIKLSYSSSGNDHKSDYTCIIHVLERGGKELIKFDTELQNSLSIVENVRLTNLQKSGKDVLLRLVESEIPADVVIWARCFPNFIKICTEYCPVTVAICRDNICTRIVQMQMAIVAAGENLSRTPTATLSVPRFHYQKVVLSATDGLIEQWRSYLIVACSTITSTDELANQKSSPQIRKRTALTERITSARDLFRMILPLLSSEHAIIRESVVTALGNINENVYKVLLEDMQPYFKSVVDDYKTKVNKQQYSNIHKRARKYERLRVELAHVYQLTAHFLVKEEIIKDSNISSLIMTFIRETIAFLRDPEVSNDWDWQKLRQYFCGVVEKLYDGFCILKLENNEMSLEMRTLIFKMIEEWCGHGKKGAQYRARETNMLTTIMDQYRDSEERRPLTTQLENDRKALEFAALSAMASLCRGNLAKQESGGTRKQLLDADSVFPWIQSVFEDPQDRLHPIARTQGYFLALAEVFFENKDYPFQNNQPCSVLALALFKTGDADLEVRHNALKLLNIIETRFYKESCTDEFKVGITSQLSSIYKQAQIALSTRLAQNTRKRDEEKRSANINNDDSDIHEETHYMLSESSMRFESIPEKGKKEMLRYLAPWVRNIELRFTDKGELHPTTFIMISNLFFITVKYGDIFVREIEKLWQQLVMGEHARNVRAIVKFLIDVGLEKRNPIFVFHAKRVFVYLGRTPTCQAVIDALIKEITPKSMTPQPKETLEREDYKLNGMFLAKIEDAMPQHNKKPVFSSGQLALLYMVDMAIEAGPVFEFHLQQLFHVLFVQLDSPNPLISEETKALLVNLIHSIILCRSVYPEVIKLGHSLVAELKAKESQLWAYEDITYSNRNIKSLSDLEKLAKDVVTIFSVSFNREELKQTWGEIALKWATSCPVRHIACRSFQIFRSLDPGFNLNMLAAVLARLSNTISDNSEDIQGFALEILITINHVVDGLEPDTKEIFPQLLWAIIACLQTTNEPEYLEALSILDKILDKYNVCDEENHEIFWSFFPEKWIRPFNGIQPLLMKGIGSSTACQKTFDMLKKLLFMQDAQLVDPTPGRYLYLLLANLPRLVHSLEDESIREECKEWAKYLSEIAEQQSRHNILNVLNSYNKGRFRTKDDFLKQVILVLRDNYFPDYEVQILLFLMSLLANKTPYYKLKTMTILKMLLPHIDTQRDEFTKIGSELILPLLRLLNSSYSQEALEVLDESITISVSPAKDKQIVRMSLSSRRGKEIDGTASLFGDPDEHGWSIPDRQAAMEATRLNVHAVCYTCKTIPQQDPNYQDDPDYQLFSDNIDINGGYSDETQTDHKIRDIVSKLQDLNEYFLLGDDVLSNSGNIANGRAMTITTTFHSKTLSDAEHDFEEFDDGKSSVNIDYLMAEESHIEPYVINNDDIDAISPQGQDDVLSSASSTDEDINLLDDDESILSDGNSSSFNLECLVQET
ncbi:35844_t:CDS:10 [Gigaspora margarita]|uniref:35844_t:CDS:1 n=1 Tax=Gigaspora margarita TaxID=4874 RepID=A0ABN7URJ5_GIGMA|nr:35844_t:CDS:10 [Gigaspora margarita]